MGDSSPNFESINISENLFLNPENVLKNHVLFENHQKEQPYFEKRANLNRHIQRIYENKTFDKRANLNHHIKRIYENKNPFPCKACYERFPKNSSLQTHIISVHEGKKLFNCDELFRCTTCDVRFTLKGSLNKHMVRVHKQSISYKCKRCDSTFEERLDLKSHICMGRKDALNLNVETDHENKKPTKSGIKCTRCDDSFLDEKALRDHYIKEHTRSYGTTKRL